MTKPNCVDIGQLRTGDIVLQHTVSYFLRPSTWVAWIIRKCTNSKWNHSGEVFKLGVDIYILEAIGGGIALTTRSEFKKQDALIKVIRLKGFENKFNNKDYLIKGLRQLDKRYDYFGILKIFIFVCVGYRENPSKQISQTKWRCSEFNAWMKNIRGWQSWFPGDFDNNNDFDDII